LILSTAKSIAVDVMRTASNVSAGKLTDPSGNVKPGGTVPVPEVEPTGVPPRPAQKSLEKERCTIRRIKGKAQADGRNRAAKGDIQSIRWGVGFKQHMTREAVKESGTNKKTAGPAGELNSAVIPSDVSVNGMLVNSGMLSKSKVAAALADASAKARTAAVLSERARNICKLL
jgi:hypothetical protein